MKVDESVTASWKIELRNMVQICDRVSVYANEALRIQARAYACDRRSMFVAGIL